MKVLTFISLLFLAASGIVQAADTQPAPPVAKQAEGLDAQTLYEFLIGEIAGQRGDLVLASDAYVDLARKTRDPRIARRAAEIAIYMRDLNKATEMARLWVELEPESVQANRMLIGTLIGTGQLKEAKPRIEALLQQKDASPGEILVQMQGLLSHAQDKQAALRLVRELAAPYPNLPEAHQAVALSAINAGDMTLALSELDAMLRLRPASELAALLKGEALASQGNAAVLAFWKDFLAARVRLVYARELTRAGRYDEARQEFETLTKASPESPELHLALGLIDMQTGDLDAAEQAFRQALDLKYPDAGLVDIYLGQVEEARGHYEQALAWYDQVVEGGHALQARFKAALVLAKMGKVDDALARLKKMEADIHDSRVRIVQTEVQVLRGAKRYQDAYDLLSRELEKTPDNGDLLYDRAMVAEKLDLLPAMEADLRRLIKLQPDSAQAYNALGYTLVDRTSRVEEGIALIGKALELSPDDPFILDSMGWGQFKAGRLDKAVDYLRQAYQGRADPEIAAHLGEVLWQKGEHDEASQIWRAAFKAHPDNDMLRSTMARFGQ